MDEGGYLLILRPATSPPGTPGTGSPLPVAILMEVLRDRTGLPVIIGPPAAPKSDRI
jgi:hypothetical protein